MMQQRIRSRRNDGHPLCRRMGPTTAAVLILGLFFAVVSSSINIYFTRHILSRVVEDKQEDESTATPLRVRNGGRPVVRKGPIINLTWTSPPTGGTPRRIASVVARGLAQTPFVDGGVSGSGTVGTDDSKSTLLMTSAVTSNSCVWSPTSSGPCSEMLRRRLTLPVGRLLFLGDSTIHNLVNEGVVLEKALVDDALQHCPDSSCHVRTTERCNRTYGVPESIPNELWSKPNLPLREGPISTGFVNPGCSDCSKCDSRFVICAATEPENRCRVPHGGYVYMEFARDVVWQTTSHRTTQENTADLLHDGSVAYPDTVCAIAAGLHDMDIFVNDVSIYVRNVRWYLSLYLDRVCRHIVWLANASPLSDNYTQTIAKTKEWNEAVRYELSSDTFLNSTTYIDLWSASQTWPHDNNLHMDVQWNVHLSQLFVQSLWLRDDHPVVSLIAF